MSKIVECHSCNGTGKIREQEFKVTKTGPAALGFPKEGYYVSTDRFKTCSACSGSGKIKTTITKTKCEDCGGSGVYNSNGHCVGTHCPRCSSTGYYDKYEQKPF